MEYGVYLNPQAPRDARPVDALTGVERQARAARAAGFDLLTVGHHFLTDYVNLQPIPLLARLSAASGSMAVSTGVLLLPLHHPVAIAEQVATLDAMAADVRVGVGAGYRDAEFEAFGVPADERWGRLREGIELLERLWTETNVTYDGRYYAVEDATITPRPAGKPPVWVGGYATAAIERAAGLGDAWIASTTTPLPELREQRRAYDEACAALGREGSLVLLRDAFVAETTEAAVEAARDPLLEKYDRYRSWGQTNASGDRDAAFEALAEDRFLLGSPEAVRAEVERYRRDLDVDALVLRVNWPGLPHERSAAAIERFGEAVLPGR